MVKKEKTKLYRVGGTDTIVLPSKIKTDSSFPLNLSEELTIEIVGKKVVIYNE